MLYKALETEKIAKLVGKMAVKETSAYNKEGLEEFVEWVVKGYGQK